MASSGCEEIIYSINLKLDFNLQPLNIIKVLGDGSCFFHAVLRGFHRSYIKSTSIQDRQNLAKKLRTAIALVLEEIDPQTGLREYDKLGGGSYAEFNKAVSGATDKRGDLIIENNKYSLKGLQQELNSNDPVDHAYIEMLSNHFNKDIYLIDANTRDVYPTGTDLKLLYKNRDSIVILYSPGHYDVIGIKRIAETTIPDICNKGDVIFDCLFHPQHQFIQSIQRRLQNLIKE
jgi:hypothetical protein